MLLNAMGEDFARAGDDGAAAQCFEKEQEAHQRSQPIRKVAMDSEQLDAEGLKETR